MHRATVSMCDLRAALCYRCATVMESRMWRADDALLGLSGQDKLCVLALRVSEAGIVEKSMWSQVIFRVNRFLPATGAECSRSPTPAPSALQAAITLSQVGV